jgi:hypothetical protein
MYGLTPWTSHRASDTDVRPTGVGGGNYVYSQNRINWPLDVLSPYT